MTRAYDYYPALIQPHPMSSLHHRRFDRRLCGLQAVYERIVLGRGEVPVSLLEQRVDTRSEGWQFASDVLSRETLVSHQHSAFLFSTANVGGSLRCSQERCIA